MISSRIQDYSKEEARCQAGDDKKHKKTSKYRLQRIPIQSGETLSDHG